MWALVPVVTVAFAKALFGGLVAVVGLGLVYTGLGTLRANVRRGAFEPVRARVTASSLRQRSGSKTTTTYAPQIEYEYTVGGVTYTSDSVYPGNISGSDDREKHATVVENHPTGATVEAFYDPDDPSTSFLVEESTLSGGLIALSSGLLLVLGGIFFIVNPVLNGLAV